MLGVFPLNIVVLPDELVALHLFEPRYRELFHDHKEGKEFVILYVDKKGKSTHGTRVFIKETVNEFPDGTIDVIVKGRSIVKITEFVDFYPEKLYSAVKDEIIELDRTATDKLSEIFKHYITSQGKKLKKTAPFTLFYIANCLSLSSETKNKLVILKSPNDLNRFLLNEIKFLIKIREQEENLNQNYHLN